MNPRTLLVLKDRACPLYLIFFDAMRRIPWEKGSNMIAVERHEKVRAYSMDAIQFIVCDERVLVEKWFV